MARSSRTSAERAPRIVVLVEDDDGLRGALERMLRIAGFEVMTFASAEHALSVCDAYSVNCLVVDLNLPAMSGLDLIERLQSLGIRTPVIIISAQDGERVRAHVLRSGAVGFLAKPFPGNTLVDAVGRACGMD